MLKVREKYLVDEKGRKTAIVLNVREYRRLLERLEDLEDALDLDEARRVSTGSKPYAPYAQAMCELKQRERVSHGIAADNQ
jgi:hypothetical protein